MATAGGEVADGKLGAVFLTYMNIYRDSHHSSCQHRERQELAKHAVVHPCSGLCEVAMTAVVHAVGAFHLVVRNSSLMDMKRRQ